jgi:hypothetical protein
VFTGFYGVLISDEAGCGLVKYDEEYFKKIPAGETGRERL